MKYKNEIKFNGAFSTNNLPKKIKDGAYVINLDEYANTGMHWIALFCNKNTVIYFDSFGVEHILKKLKNLLKIKTKTNIFCVQENDSIMCGYFCIGFIGFMLAVKKFVFSKKKNKKKTDNIILSYFKSEWK